MTDAVFWQAVFYMGSFLMCWPIYYIAAFRVLEKWDKYGFWVAVVVLFPLQGFWNAFVYFRLRIVQYFQQRKRRRREAKQAANSAATSSSLQPSTTHRNSNPLTDNDDDPEPKTDA